MNCWKEIKQYFYKFKSYIWYQKKIADIFLLVSEFYQFPKEEMGFVVVVFKEKNEKNKVDLKYLINYSNPHKCKSS